MRERVYQTRIPEWGEEHWEQGSQVLATTPDRAAVQAVEIQDEVEGKDGLVVVVEVRLADAPSEVHHVELECRMVLRWLVSE